MVNVIIAAGGTGGHVFPGLAVAKKLIERGDRVVWYGTESGMESSVVPKEKIALEAIKVKPLRGKGVVGALLGLCFFVYAVLQVLFKFIVNRPDVVLVMGGYVAAPVGIAAKLMGVKLFLHEQNAVAGWANKLLFHFADQVFLGFAGAFVGEKVKVVGNPVREEVGCLKQSSKGARLKCLVLGGSQGAAGLNEKISAAWLQMPKDLRPQLWHQVGIKNEKLYQAQYADYSELVQVEGFVTDMAKAYAWADVVVARSGAMTVAECLAAGLPVAWVPYPYATDDHQCYNAKAFLALSQGWLWQQNNLDVQSIMAWWQNCSDCLQGSGFQAKKVSNSAVVEMMKFF